MTRATRGTSAVLLTAAAYGTAWGVAARVWMRLVATDPVFTWTGSAFIVVPAALAATMAGAVRLVRCAGRPRRMGRMTSVPRVVSKAPQGHDHEARCPERKAKRIRVHDSLPTERLHDRGACRL